MNLLREIETFFRRLLNKPHDNVILTLDNVDNWPRFRKLLDEGKVIADSTGRLRYPHGAPVGRMTISSKDARGMSVYKEAADEWFDPESPNAQNMELYSTITCPKCGHSKRELMPTDACQFFYECDGCGELLKPKKGDCCVYCSFGDTKCPPIQEGSSCCT